MSGASKAEAVHSAIEEASSLLDIPCSRSHVQQVLGAFGDGVSEESVIVLAMAGGERHRGDIDYNFTVPTHIGDPYKIAVAAGLLDDSDHPASRLLADIAERCRVSFYGVEAGVAGGFKKTYIFFPLDELGRLDVLAQIPSMPKAVAEHAAAFARNDMANRISIVGIDYLSQTMNIYYMAAPVDQQMALDLLGDLDLPAPSDDLLRFIPDSFSIYPTYSWDSAQIKRICFSAVSPDRHAYPTTLHPEIAEFAANAPYEYGGARVLVYGATISRAEEYHKLGVYFRRPAAFWNSLPLAATFERLAAAQAAAGN